MQQIIDHTHIKSSCVRVQQTIIIDGLYGETFVYADIYLKDMNGNVLDMLDHCIYDSRYVAGFGASDELIALMQH